MATITRHRSRWQIKIRRKGYPRICKTFVSRKDAEIWARQIEGDMACGTFVDRSEADLLTYADVLRRYMAEVLPRKRGGDREVSKLKPYIEHPLVNKPLSAIKPQDMAFLRDWRLEQVSPGTVLREFCVLRNAFEVAARDWFLPIENPIKRVRLPSPNPPRARRLMPGELDAILASGMEYGGVMPLLTEWLVETGMRREEAATLRRANIDLAVGVAFIRFTKNGQPRSVPLTERAASIVCELPVRDDGLLFGLRPDSITQAFGRICARVGIDGLTLHDLRHEATSRLVEKGLTMPEVMAITGHRDPRMMLRYYQPSITHLVKRVRD